MKYLIDSNIWLEPLLEQQNADEVKKLFSILPINDMAITEFTLYTIALKLAMHQRMHLFENFVLDILGDDRANLLNLSPRQLIDVSALVSNGPLDFDDAYQYVAAERYNLRIISYDKDFDKTPQGRIMPAQILKQLGAD